MPDPPWPADGRQLSQPASDITLPLFQPAWCIQRCHVRFHRLRNTCWCAADRGESCGRRSIDCEVLRSVGGSAGESQWDSSQTSLEMPEKSSLWIYGFESLTQEPCRFMCILARIKDLFSKLMCHLLFALLGWSFRWLTEVASHLF